MTHPHASAHPLSGAATPSATGRGLFIPVVVSLYDFTGEAVKPWAAAGYDCHCFDIQHDAAPRVEQHGAGRITYRRADLHKRDTHAAIVAEFEGRAAFMLAFPVCTDMAVSGAAHFAAKLARDPDTHHNAVAYAVWCAETGDALGVPYVIENPVSILSTRWRKPDHSFHPFEYGGYISADDAAHPTWPEYIAPFDAYPKKTCLWTGGGFSMPGRKPVDCPAGYSTQHKKLGGKSQKTKNIRSATPRGFAMAVFHSNSRSPAPPRLHTDSRGGVAVNPGANLEATL